MTVILLSLKYPLSFCYIDELKAIALCLEKLNLLPDNVYYKDIRDCLYSI